MRSFRIWHVLALLPPLAACGGQVVGWEYADDTRPTVTHTTPLSDATSIARNVPVSATFSEPMAPGTITDITFTLDDGSPPLGGTVTYAGLTALFAPDDLLEGDSLYTATVHRDVADLAGNTMAADYVWTFRTSAFVDLTAPEVITTNPIDQALDIGLTANVYATFNEPMAQTSLSTATFTLSDGATDLPGVVFGSGPNVVFDPVADLVLGVTYTATISTGATDLAGNNLAADYVWTFTARTVIDEIPPFVVATNPTDAADFVVVGSPVIAAFSETMDLTTVNDTTFTVTGPGTTPVAGTVVYNVLVPVGTFTPDDDLAEGVVYTATVSTGVEDLAGNAMVADRVWTFTTRDDSDDAPPFVVVTNPTNGASLVGIGSSVTAAFSETMDLATVNGTSFTVTGPGTTPVAGSVVYDPLLPIGTFTPDDDLAEGVTYTATVSTDVEDLAGNNMLADRVWTFTTRDDRDDAPPYVVVTNPTDGATLVPIGSSVTAAFSETMDLATVNDTTFLVTGPGTTPVPGSVTYSVLLPLGTFTPDVALAEGVTYTATVTNDVQDLAGNNMLIDRVWTFTTRDDSDDAPPFVVVTNPTNGASLVGIGSSVTAAFSETMDLATVNDTTFLVTGPGTTPVPGSVIYSALLPLGTFTPDDDLAEGVIYTATVTNDVQDLAGNNMVTDHVWTFTTRDDRDDAPPWVVLTNPTDLAFEVPVSTTVTAAFSEAMDPLTINALTFTLVGPGPTEIDGSLVYDSLVPRATFTPDTDLDVFTTYVATVTSDVTDLAGNPMTFDHVWSFETGAIRDIVPPFVVETMPFNTELDVPADTLVLAAFSEAMDPTTLDEVTFMVTGPGSVPVIGSLSYDPTSLVVTFAPDSPLMLGTVYDAVITTDAKDLAGNSMLLDYAWSFTTVFAPTGLQPLNLRSLESFVAVAGSGLTNSNSSGTTTLNGDVGLSPTGTCMGDGSPCTITNPVINGTLYINDPEGIAAQAKTDLVAAYVEGMALPPGTTVNDITGMTLVPGVYTSGSTMSIAVGGTVYLDAQGNPDAVWIFQIGSSLTVNQSAQILLLNGARAKNVFWLAFASSTLGGDVRFQGNVLAGASNSVGTDTVVVGRLLCTTGQITLLSNNITLPPN